jgi:hypothetical protein
MYAAVYKLLALLNLDWPYLLVGGDNLYIYMYMYSRLGIPKVYSSFLKINTLFLITADIESRL